MKIIYNSFIPFKGFIAINLFGTLFVRNEYKNKKSVLNQTTLNHEAIHSEQIKELWYVLFYIIYLLEWIFRLFQYGPNKNAYRNISFEREAYDNDSNYKYIETRKKYAMWKR